MATFYTAKNNGVLAAISTEDAERYGISKTTGGHPPLHPKIRVFTFVNTPSLTASQKMFYTGTQADFNELVGVGGHLLAANFGDWDGYVPFSNGIEFYEGEGKERELAFLTTLRNVLDVFGIIPTEPEPEDPKFYRDNLRGALTTNL